MVSNIINWRQIFKPSTKIGTSVDTIHQVFEEKKNFFGQKEFFVIYSSSHASSFHHKCELLSLFLKQGNVICVIFNIGLAHPNKVNCRKHCLLPKHREWRTSPLSFKTMISRCCQALQNNFDRKGQNEQPFRRIRSSLCQVGSFLCLWLLQSCRCYLGKGIATN